MITRARLTDSFSLVSISPMSSTCSHFLPYHAGGPWDEGDEGKDRALRHPDRGLWSCGWTMAPGRCFSYPLVLVSFPTWCLSVVMLVYQRIILFCLENGAPQNPTSWSPFSHYTWIGYDHFQTTPYWECMKFHRIIILTMLAYVRLQLLLFVWAGVRACFQSTVWLCTSLVSSDIELMILHGICGFVWR